MKFSSAIAFIVICCITGSCVLTSNNMADTQQFDESAWKRLDAIDEKMWYQYVNNPDSAEKMLHQTIKLLDSMRWDQKKLYAYMHLTELYLYRKPDYEKAMHNLSRAMTIFISTPGPYYDNAYVYVDIGNIFSKFRFFSQAITLYRLAYQFAGKYNNLSAQALTLLNIGLMKQYEHQVDSALWYYRRSDKIVTDRSDFLLAYSYNYVAELQLTTGIPDSAEQSTRRGLKILENYRKSRPEMAKGLHDTFFLAWNEISAKSAEILYAIYLQKNNSDSTKKYFNRIMQINAEVISPHIEASLWFRHLMFSSPLNLKQADFDRADSVIFRSRKPKDLNILKNFADSLSLHFNRNQMPLLSGHYRQYALTIEDSLSKLRGTNKFAESTMLMSTAAFRQNLQQLTEDQELKQQTITQQRVALIIFSLFVIIILILLFVFWKQKAQLEIAYQNLTERIRQSLHIEPAALPVRMDADGKWTILEKKLRQLNEKEKVYLDKELNLNKLAALLNTNQTYLSNMLNNVYGLNFNDYLNKQRVDEACRLVILNTLNLQSFDQIALQSGFNSKSTFYASFRKFTGMSPAVFLKNSMKE